MIREPKICTVSMIKDTEENIRRFAAYHIGIGIHEVLILLDSSDYDRKDRLNKLDGVTCRCIDKEFFNEWCLPPDASLNSRQLACVNYGLQYARTNSFDWIAHIDIDELIYPFRPLSEVLKSAIHPILKFRLFEAVAENPLETDLYKPRLFKSIGTPRRRRLARILTFGRPFYHGEYFRGHVFSKVIVQAQNDKIIEMKIHNAVHADGFRGFKCDDIALLHFDGVGYDIVRTKWTLRDKRNVKNLRTSRRRICNDFDSKAITDRTRQIRKFKRLYMLPGYSQWILRVLKLTREFHIQESCFSFTDTKEIESES